MSEQHTGSNASLLLEALTGAMGVQNLLGTAEEAKARAPERITWVRRRNGRYTTPQGQDPDVKILWVYEQLYVVTLWGTDERSADELHDLLIRKLDALFSRNDGVGRLGGYRPVDAEALESDVGSQGSGLALQLVLLVPLYGDTYTQATISDGTQDGTFEDAEGQNPEAIPNG